MKASIYKPKNPLLADCIDYFLFLKNSAGSGNYKTFPNTNLCLALYKKNAIDWNKEKNSCLLTECPANPKSMLFGFHKKPFSVFYQGEIVQTCILFKPGGLSFFTKIPVNKIDHDDDPFTQIFGKNLNDFAERIFSSDDEEQQVAIWEDLLLQKLTSNSHHHRAVAWAIDQMKLACTEEGTIVSRLSGQLGINASTLYRNFLSTVGQGPKELYKTVRFRNSLSQLLARQQSVTHVAYNNNFFDQSHLIKDIHQFTGESPKRLQKRITEIQGTLLWVQE
ncbi:MAG: helix-turn-helix transcriptional regulator [Bacteroidota bacterium]